MLSNDNTLFEKYLTKLKKHPFIAIIITISIVISGIGTFSDSLTKICSTVAKSIEYYKEKERSIDKDFSGSWSNEG